MKTEKDFVNEECIKCIYEHVSTDACHIVRRMDGSWDCPNKKLKEINLSNESDKLIEIQIPIKVK